MRHLAISREGRRITYTRTRGNVYTLASNDIPHSFDIQEFHERMRRKYASKMQERNRTWRAVKVWILFNIVLGVTIGTAIVTYLVKIT